MKLIPLTQGQFAKVDDWWYDYLVQWKWCAVFDKEIDGFYAIRMGNKDEKKKKIRMHRVVAKTPDKMQCDHRNHDTLNNQEGNLRNCSSSQNSMNRNIRKDNTSGFKGVCKFLKKWRAQIHIDGKRVYCENFNTALDAALAYDTDATI